MRHTVATTLLAQNTPVHVVAARLGHANPSITLSTYAHALPDAQQAAAAAISAVLHGRS
jgi:integrase